MKKILLIIGVLMSCSLVAENTLIKMQTSEGDIYLKLYDDKAPKSVANFLQYVKDDFYDGTVFHRVISTFMIQGGGFTEDLQRKPTRAPIDNEADNGLKNDRGTIAMARLPDPHSATAQFFINVQDNAALNFTGKQNTNTWGYAVFGKVTEGFDVLDKIAEVKTTTVQGYQDVPVETIKILEAEVID